MVITLPKIKLKSFSACQCHLGESLTIKTWEGFFNILFFFYLYVFSHHQTLAPSVVGLVSDLEYMRTKIQNLRRRWNDIQTSHLNQVVMRGSFEHKSSVWTENQKVYIQIQPDKSLIISNKSFHSGYRLWILWSKHGQTGKFWLRTEHQKTSKLSYQTLSCLTLKQEDMRNYHN